MRVDRDDDMVMTGKRHAFQYEYDVGFDASGRIRGLELMLASRCGFSADLSGPVNDRAMFHVDNCLLPGERRDHVAPLQDQHGLRTPRSAASAGRRG